MKECRCRFNWRELRKALDLTQRQMAIMLSCDETTIQRAESLTDHHCPRPGTVKLLRIYLQDPELKARLRIAGYPHPFPEDLNADVPATS